MDYVFVSNEAQEFYYENKFPSYPECHQPCLRMDVEAMFKTKSETSNSQMSFIFPREIPVTEEFYTATPLSLGGNIPEIKFNQL